MKKFIQTSLIFSAPLLLLAIGVAFMPLSKHFSYHYLKRDCDNRAAWVYHRIFENKKPIDVLFVGSSHTRNAVKDSLIEVLYWDRKKEKKHILNIGFCAFGNNLFFAFIKDALSQKKIKEIVVEVRADEVSFGHHSFPYIADAEDVFMPELWGNGHGLSDGIHAEVMRWQALREKLLHLPSADSPVTYPSDFGFSPHLVIPPIEVLKEAELHTKKRYASLEKQWGNALQYRFSWAYLQKISELATASGAKLSFLYLPDYGSPTQEPFFADVYRQWGQIHIPPDSIIRSSDSWADGGHLGVKGATKMAYWWVDKDKLSTPE